MRTTSNILQRTLFPGLASGENDQILKMLQAGWGGCFREKIYPLLDASEVEAEYCGNNGRPTKNLTTLLGTRVLQQAFGLTDGEALLRLAADSSFHMALSIDKPTDKSVYCCPKTYWTFRKKLRGTESGERIVNCLAQKFISELECWRQPSKD
jgi:hypothetical protein